MIIFRIEYETLGVICFQHTYKYNISSVFFTELVQPSLGTLEAKSKKQNSHHNDHNNGTAACTSILWSLWYFLLLACSEVKRVVVT